MSSKLSPWFITGIADGEGCFSIHGVTRKRRYFYATFALSLRADDRVFLMRIKEYFGVGSLCYAPRKSQKERNPGTCPQWCFKIEGKDCHVARRHFDAYPLQSKKAAEYPVWREFILLPRGTPQEYQEQLQLQLSHLKRFAEHLESPVIEDAQQILNLQCKDNQPKEVKQ